METLKSFLDQSLLIWKDSTAAARFGIGLLLLICVGSIIGVGIWSSRPQFVQLAGDLDPAKAAKLIDALEAAGIDYEQQGQSSVSVDRRKRAQAQRAAIGLGIGQASFDRVTPGPWASPAEMEQARLHNRQLDLKFTLEGFASIEKATVLVGEPEQSPMLGRNRIAPSASVQLMLSSQSDFNDTTAASVASLVADAVPGLMPEHVTIVDSTGRKYRTDASYGNLGIQEEVRRRREKELEQNAAMVLLPTLGYENFTVKVTTDFSFPDETIESVEVDPESKSVSTEKILTELTTAENKSALGPPGVTSNLGNSSPIAGKKEIVTQKEDSTSEFLFSKTEKKQKRNTPIRNWMSVSVVINSKKLADENGVVSPQTIASYEGQVRAAVGFREGTDEIKVDFMPFQEREVVAVPSPLTTLPWDNINELLKNLSLGLAAIVTLFVAFKILRKIQPEPSIVQEANDRGSQVDQLSDLVKQNPEVFSKIIESWSSLDSKTEDEEEFPKSHAA